MAATKRGKPKTPTSKKATVKAAAARVDGTSKEPRRAAARRPVSDAERARVRALHAKGVGRNEIAREIGRAASVVTKIIKADGGSFDRTATAEAVAARVEDMKARRLEIADMLLADVEKLHERLWSEHQYYERGPDAMVPVTLPLPPLRDVRDGYGAIGLALRGHQDMMRESTAASTESKRSVLGDLLTGLQAAYDADKAAGILVEAAPDEPAGEQP